MGLLHYKMYSIMLIQEDRENDADQMARDDYNDKDQMEWSDDDYQQMAAENEAAEQLPHFPNLDDYQPEYVLASTSDLVEETMVFPSNEQGDSVTTAVPDRLQ